MTKHEKHIGKEKLKFQKESALSKLFNKKKPKKKHKYLVQRVFPWSKGTDNWVTVAKCHSMEEAEWVVRAGQRDKLIGSEQEDFRIVENK